MCVYPFRPSHGHVARGCRARAECAAGAALCAHIQGAPSLPWPSCRRVCAGVSPRGASLKLETCAPTFMARIVHMLLPVRAPLHALSLSIRRPPLSPLGPGTLGHSLSGRTLYSASPRVSQTPRPPHLAPMHPSSDIYSRCHDLCRAGGQARGRVDEVHRNDGDLEELVRRNIRDHRIVAPALH
jgi:hypothetical protein